MPGAATAHPNAQGASPQQPGVVQGQMPPRNQNLFFRPTNVPVPRYNLGWTSHNALNVSNPAPQASTSGFQTAVSSVTFMPQPPYGLPQTMLGRSAQPLNMPTYQFPNACPPSQAQFNIQAQPLYLSAGSANLNPYGHNQRPVFYSHMQQIPSVIPSQMSTRNNVQALPPQQASQQAIPPPAPKRERRPLRIQHPDTLEDINLKDEHDYSDPTGPDHNMVKENSQMEPVPTDQTDTRIQFAQQVAAVAIPGPSRKEPLKQECVAPIHPVPVVLGVPQSILVASAAPTDLLLEPADRTNLGMNLDRQPEPVDMEDEIVEDIPEYELGAPILIPSHEVIVGSDTQFIDSLENLEEEPYSTEDCAEETPFEVEQMSDEGFPVEDICESSEQLEEESMPQSIVRTCTPSPPLYQADEVILPPVSDSLPVTLPVTEVATSTDKVLPPPVPLSSPPRDSPTPEEEDVVYEETRVELSVRPQQNGDLGTTIFVESKDTLEARDNKKKVKKKVRDLNKKGEGKEGSEMDAFVVDKEEEVSPLVSSQNFPPPLATKIVLSSPDREEDEEEQRKVAEKNQENTRVSGPKEDGLTTPVIEPPEVKPQVPKYSYKEDQWSPLNPEGKKQYDRAFLLKMQSQPMSLKKPEGLPNLEVIKDIAMQFKLPDHGSRPTQPPMQVVHRGNQPDFMPPYARGGTPRPPQGGVNRRQSQQGRDKPKKIINISTSFNEDVKLHSSQNAWKPTSKAADIEPTSTSTSTEEEAKTQDLYKKVRGILNKLTPQKFLTLLDQVKDMPIDTEERLKGVIDLVFEKAVDEPNFSVPYANMCKHLAMKAVPSGQNNQIVNFRKLLLTKCQKEFESDSRDEIRRAERLQEISIADPEKRKQMTEELEEELRKSRRRSLGNIKFIGELYKLSMLVTPIMHDCLKKLLKAEDEDSLECLCRLLTTVGKELEANKKSDASDKRTQNKAMMDSYFDGMKKVVDNRNTTSRVRFMIQDVIELRLNNWVPRRIENNPTTIDQIHLEAEREAQEQHMLVQQPLPSSANKRPDDRDRRKNRSMQGGGGFEEGGWNTVGGNKSRGSAAFNYDPSKVAIKFVSKPLETDSIQLGPSTRGWGKGSSGGGTRASNQDSDSKSNVATNRYQALANQDSEPRRTIHQSSSSSREPSRGRGSQGGGGPPLTLRKTPSQSNQISTTERESAKETVKTFFQNPPQPSTNSIQEPSRETPEPKEIQPATVAVTQPSSYDLASKGQVGEFQLIGRDMDMDEMTKKATPIIDEYLHNNDLTEAIQCIIELASPASIHLFVSFSINHVLERSSRARISLGQLLRELMAKTILSLDQTLMGLESIFEAVIDLEIDIPKVWGYLAEILFPLVQDGCLTFGTLEKAAALCIQQGFGGKMFSNLLLVMAEHLNPNKIQELWQKSGLQWSNILKPDEDVKNFIAVNKLEFTMQGVRAAPPESFPIEEIKAGLETLLKRNASNENIFDWIEGKLDRDSLVHPSFIRALVTAVTEYAIEESLPDQSWDMKKLRDRAVILTRFIDSKDHLELQALYALQALDYKLQHPKAMLGRIFDALYDEDVISEDAFSQWEKSEDPAENEGRGVALKSVTSFFTWLQEAEEEEDEN